MSDEDLDVVEIVYWAIVDGIDPGNTAPTYQQIQTMLAGANCWRQMSRRSRRELVISKMLDLMACWDAATMETVIRVTKANTSAEQREAALDWLRYNGLVQKTCGDIP